MDGQSRYCAECERLSRELREVKVRVAEIIKQQDNLLTELRELVLMFGVLGLPPTTEGEDG